ncbi:MAG: flavodoxin family protein [Caulobacter sp.]|nr:flavodoxin family protein [Caulobacter sp.]
MSKNPRRILVINGHPDPDQSHLCAALAEAYARGATAGGFSVERLDVGALDFPLIRSMTDYQSGRFTEDIKRAQRAMEAADHLALIFPIWFGAPPAALKGFFEQVLRKGFAISAPQAAMFSLMSGKSARLIVTMGAPASVFQLLLGGHGVASLERGLLWVTGVAPVRRTLLGGAHRDDPTGKARWLARIEALGRSGT